MCVLVDVAEWHSPSAGMFLWMKLKSVADTQQLIMEKALEKEVSAHKRHGMTLMCKQQVAAVHQGKWRQVLCPSRVWDGA